MHLENAFLSVGADFKMSKKSSSRSQRISISIVCPDVQQLDEDDDSFPESSDSSLDLKGDQQKRNRFSTSVHKKKRKHKRNISLALLRGGATASISSESEEEYIIDKAVSSQTKDQKPNDLSKASAPRLRSKTSLNPLNYSTGKSTVVSNICDLRNIPSDGSTKLNHECDFLRSNLVAPSPSIHSSETCYPESPFSPETFKGSSWSTGIQSNLFPDIQGSSLPKQPAIPKSGEKHPHLPPINQLAIGLPSKHERKESRECAKKEISNSLMTSNICTRSSVARKKVSVHENRALTHNIPCVDNKTMSQQQSPILKRRLRRTTVNAKKSSIHTEECEVKVSQAAEMPALSQERLPSLFKNSARPPENFFHHASMPNRKQSVIDLSQTSNRESWRMGTRRKDRMRFNTRGLSHSEEAEVDISRKTHTLRK